MTTSLPQQLRDLRARLAPLLEAGEAAPPGDLAERAARVADRLDRDLLPRTAGADAHLVVGIVGPNNAGKSALWNALVGRPLSPSSPTGGATRRLLGAARPELCAKLANEPTLARFPVRVIEPGTHAVAEAGEEAKDPAELLLLALPELPPAVLLIDTPDFDSILLQNRRASEALLRVTDVAVVVVTRHTYQNRDVVEFLEGWLAHGRPWVLCYNESLGVEVTLEHAAKLAADLGTPPAAVFHAPFDLAVQRGEKPLVPTTLGGEGLAPGKPLAEWLFDLGQSTELKQRALSASLAKLRDELAAIAEGLEAEGEEAEGLLALAAEQGLRLGRRVATEAMPMGPFLDAFRAVLDRRPNLVQRGVREVLRRSRLALESAAARLGLRRATDRVATETVDLAEVERRALRPEWAAFFEKLALALRPRGEFWRAETRGPDAALAELLAADLSPEASGAARECALATLGADPDMLREFQSACEELIDAELEKSGGEWYLQLAVDAIHFLPLVAAGVVILKTGGLGADLAVGGAGAVSTLMAEKASKLLGTQLARSARERWTRLRGERLAQVLVDAALPRSAPVLRRRAAERRALASGLRRPLEDSAWSR